MIDYGYVAQEHTRVLQQIKAYESDKQVEPTDQLTLSCQLSPNGVESCNEYVDEVPNVELVRN